MNDALSASYAVSLANKNISCQQSSTSLSAVNKPSSSVLVIMYSVTFTTKNATETSSLILNTIKKQISCGNFTKFVHVYASLYNVPSYQLLIISTNTTVKYIVSSPAPGTKSQSASASASAISSSLIGGIAAAGVIFCLIIVCCVMYMNGGLKSIRSRTPEGDDDDDNFVSEHRDSIATEWNIRSTIMKFVSTGDGLEIQKSPISSKESSGRAAKVFVSTGHEDFYPSFDKAFSQQSTYAKSLYREADGPTDNNATASEDTDTNTFRVSESMRESLIKFYLGNNGGNPKSPKSSTTSASQNPMSMGSENNNNNNNNNRPDEEMTADMSNIYRDSLTNRENLYVSGAYNNNERTLTVGELRSNVVKEDEEMI